MQYRFTKHQVARSALPDAQEHKKIFLMKNLASLRATYEVRLLTFLAAERGKLLVIVVPRGFKAHESLQRLIDEFPKTIQISRRA